MQGKRITQKEFVERATKIHNSKYNYSKVEYVNSSTKVCIVCPIHGEFWQYPHSHLAGFGCHYCGAHNRNKKVASMGICDKEFASKSPIYKIWRQMLKRCYDMKTLEKQPSYKGCSVCTEWIYYSNFEKWVLGENSGYVEGWHLDKDILVKGNKVYSPETCCFVPKHINSVFKSSKSRRGAMPVGVKFRNNKYEARIKKGHATFDTKEDAFETYRREKEDIIKSLADKWKDKLEPRVYEALYNYEVEITD